MTPQPASTVVVVREYKRSVQTLLLQRNSRLVFEGGAWVFPGGKIEASGSSGELGNALRVTQFTA